MTVPLLFIHGFIGHPDDWKACQNFLNYDGPIYNLTLPGHVSLSPPPIEDGFNYIKEYIERFDIGPCHVIGYSLGGRVALFSAFKYPYLFKTLTLLSASPGINSPAEKQTRLAWDAIKIEQLKTKPLLQFLDEDWYSLNLFKTFRASSVFHDALTQRCLHHSENLAQSMLSLSPALQPSFWPKLKHLPVPLSYIYGECDSSYVTIALQLKSILPKAKIIGIPNSGHVIHLEKPAECAAILKECLHVR
jgi:2-succinyl-6-hydroxy-2,4-cyclohexadiene-1-carboxylate synthase